MPKNEQKRLDRQSLRKYMGDQKRWRSCSDWAGPNLLFFLLLFFFVVLFYFLASVTRGCLRRSSLGGSHANGRGVG